MRAFAFLCSLCCATVVYAELYQWTDADGVVHVVDDASKTPEVHRGKVTVYRAANPATLEPAAAPLSPSRSYASGSQGAFAQKLALDLGLIKNSEEDALGPLSGVGIRPAGGWKVRDLLTPEVLSEVLAAVRRAADAKRIMLSADGAEAVIRQAAAPFLSDSSVEQASLWEDAGEEPGVIIEQAPPAVTEVIYEPYYVPVPVFVDTPRFSHRPRPRDQHVPRIASPDRSEQRGPTHLPFRSSQMPFRSSQMPFGSNHPAKIGSSLQR